MKRHPTNLQGLNAAKDTDWNNKEWQDTKLKGGGVFIVIFLLVPLGITILSILFNW